jgi:transcriptional regulator with XRE-family HTH domain
MTRKELARVVGVSVRQMVRYERDEIPPPSDVLRRIAETLDLSADYLLGFKESATRVYISGKPSASRRHPEPELARSA